MREILNYPGTAVFLGTLPLLGTIVWGLIANEKRLGRVEVKLDTISSDVTVVRERLGRVEGKLEGSKIVVTHG